MECEKQLTRKVLVVVPMEQKHGLARCSVMQGVDVEARVSMSLQRETKYRYKTGPN